MLKKQKSSAESIYTWDIYRGSELVGHVLSSSRTGIAGTAHKTYKFYNAQHVYRLQAPTLAELLGHLK